MAALGNNLIVAFNDTADSFTGFASSSALADLFGNLERGNVEAAGHNDGSPYAGTIGCFKLRITHPVGKRRRTRTPIFLLDTYS